ncbi:MAG TPA: VTT domain-containing protein [Lacunisphaera sp.]|nr:VTT domain-containing protein [Lacunisphaera sp.]
MEPKRSPLKLIAVVALVLGAGALLALGVDLRGLVERSLALIRSAGPLVYFLCMAIVPAAPVPFLLFLLPVVSLFGEQLGTPLVVVLGLLATTANMALTYALARWLLRPLLARIIAWLGYKIPVVEAADETDLIVIMRVTPGIPFCVQNYLLGLAQVPFAKFILVSCAASWVQAVGFMLFGDALLHGKGKLALYSISLLLVVAAGTHFVRRHYARARKQP